MIAALMSIGNIALDRADACETVLAMNPHFDVGRIIDELRHNWIDLAPPHPLLASGTRTGEFPLHF